MQEEEIDVYPEDLDDHEEDLKEEPVKKDTRGGYRLGAGRKAGSKNIVTVRKAIMEYTSPQELKNMVDRAKKWCKSDRKMLQWYLEMCFGKPKTVDRDNTGKTVNNIALFLDKLEEQDKLPYPIHTIPETINGTTFNGDTTGSTITQ